MDITLPKTMDCRPADRPLRIALVYNRLPFPMMRGDQLTVSHLISFFAARGHAVDLYTLDFQGELSPIQSDWLKAACRTVKIYPHGRGAQLKALARNIPGFLSLQLPLQVGLFDNGALAGDVKAAVASGNYDVVYVYYLRSAPAVLPRASLHSKSGDPVHVLAMQLSQTLNAERIYRNETGALKKAFFWLEWQLLKRYEARIWQKFDRAVLIGDRDVDAVKAVCREQGQREIDNWIYGAHGTDTSKYRAASPEEIVPGRLVFSGSMLYQPNVQAVLWFVNSCWDKVREAVPGAELVIQGRDPLPEIRALDGTRSIKVTGTVPDVGAYIRSAAVCINPMLAAGGMQNKLIEYLCSAKAVVATSVANEGIMATPSAHLEIADTPETFADATIALLRDPARCAALGKAGRDFVLENWTWESHFLKLEADFYRAIDSGARPDGTALPPEDR